MRRLPRVSERDTSATRDSCYLRRRATHANRLEAVIRGQVHAGQHNSGITRTAAYDARRPYQGYDLRRIGCRVPPPFPCPSLRLINALIYQLSFGRDSAPAPAGALRGACNEGKQDVNRTLIDIDSCHQGPVCRARLLLWNIPLDTSVDPNFSKRL